MSAHAKVDGVTDRLSTAVQLSFELLSTSEATIEPLPEASRYTVKSCAATLGFVVSCTVTFCVCEMAFEQPSVAVQVRIKKFVVYACASIAGSLRKLRSEHHRSHH